MKSLRISSGLLALLAGVAFALPAAAQTQFQMIGNWLQRRGPIVQIPQGGVDGNTIVSQTGGAPRTVMFPVGAFSLMAAPGGTMTVAVPNPTIAQLATNFEIVAPNATTSALGAGTTIGGPRPIGGRIGNRVRANNWSLSNTRQYGTFAWCPQAAMNPNCGNRDSSIPAGGGAPTGSGMFHGIMRYTPGANAFGGTMQLMLDTPFGPGDVAINLGTQVGHQLIQGGGPNPKQIVGGRYAQYDTNYLAAGVRTIPISRTSPMGVILQGGPSQGPFGMATLNINYGFPWTTGMLLGSGSMGGAGTTIQSFTGSDNRTSGGSGMLSLVAGGVSRRVGVGNTFIAADSIVMTFAPPGTVPAMTPSVAAGAALLMLGAGFLLRKRLF